MQLNRSVTIWTIAFASSVVVAGYNAGEPWETLTPSQTYANAITDHTHTFGIAVVPISTALPVSSPNQGADPNTDAQLKKREVPVSQIGDGQIQAPTKVAGPDPISQIGDGQIQAPQKTAPPPVSQIGDGQIQAPKEGPPPVSQIGDGQIQAPTKAAGPDPISQIGDGQVQAPQKTAPPPVSQIGDGQIQAPKEAPPPVSQIGDGQIQAPTKAAGPDPISQIGDGQIQAPQKTAAPPISQIGDGQIQAPAKTNGPDPISQIGDGQVQATRVTTTLSPGASQIGDGQVQAAPGTPSGGFTTNSDSDDSGRIKAISCKVEGTLELILKDSELTDSFGRIGAIVANRQFQFDGPPPQAGTIYARGWSITPEGNLAIGDNDVFYQCLSGTFYNLYDESIGGQCNAVHLQAVDLIDC